MSVSDPSEPKVYISRDVSPSVPRNESFWQALLQCNPDLVEDEKVILQEHENRQATLTYGDARRRASEGAAGLKSVLGLNQGDVVALLGKNSISWILAAYAAIWAGVTVSCVIPFFFF